MSGLPAALSIEMLKAAWMARALNIMVILLVGFLLAAPAVFAQSLDDANALAQQVIELTKQAHLPKPFRWRSAF
jgi:hypothetical protein